MFPTEYDIWRRANGLAFIEICAVVYVGYLALIVIFFRKRETSFAVICSVCAVLCFAQPIGVLIALMVGWTKAGKWQMRSFMTLWTALVLLLLVQGLAAYLFAEKGPAFWRKYFGVEFE